MVLAVGWKVEAKVMSESMGRARRLAYTSVLAVVAIGLAFGWLLLHFRDASEPKASRKAVATRCQVEVRLASLLVFDAIREGRPIDQAWDSSAKSISSYLSDPQALCPCLRSRWMINPSASQWTSDEIAADPILAIAAWTYRRGEAPTLVIVTASGSTKLGTMNDLPDWATGVPIESLE